MYGLSLWRYNETVVDILEKRHIASARAVKSTYGFVFSRNWRTLHPICYHNDERLEELIKRFVETINKYNNPEMFYL